MGAQAILNNSQSPLRVMFTSTLAVVDYVGASGNSSPTEAEQSCEYNVALDLDVLCNVTSKTAFHTDKTNVAEKANYSVGTVAHFVSFETTSTLEDKMNAYLNYSAAGWAAFDIERDVKATCLDPQPQHRLGLMAAKIADFNKARKAEKQEQYPLPGKASLAFRKARVFCR
ncbi:hypothetical protein MRX96_056736 [Rhipicephalus microplus]